ncbi:acyl-CoA thioesterase [Brevibacillus sp. SYP-B805]|uniref:acyl-CoA thioesterase n=1 Tax=Brevibacillus sp. SYP-B805 TaxID=1578199 RepID=UPI0013EA7154|nr:thioesterase family protein [Brevibacillus sp. SYP-B805]NGQ94846.1 acyl-CoA thioesterase [Brevibacillus sp. SYP-B805]
MSKPMHWNTEIRVRYSETDQMGVVYHANYLHWFEVGRTDFLRGAGFSYRELEEQGLLLPVTDASLSYKQPARYDDVVVVRTCISRLTPLRLAFGYEITRPGDGQLLVTGETMHVFTNAAFKPVRLSRQLPELYAWLEEAYHANQAARAQENAAT